jgi:hypothetical protein
MIHLRTKGLYRLTLNTDIELTSAIEKSKYLNWMDEALITICSLISPDLLFHISSCKTPNEAWTTLEGLFGKKDEMRGHMLDVLTILSKLGHEFYVFVSTFHFVRFTSGAT